MTTVTVQIPQTLYHRLQETANRLQKPVSDLVTETLQAALPSTDEVPEVVRAAVAALDELDEVALRQVAENQMLLEDQVALEQLLDLQSVRLLTSEEEVRLETLRLKYGHVLLRKARAYALLAERGVAYSLE